MLRGSVAATDNGGTVSFLDNGTPIKGCAFVPITPAAECQTSGLAAGAQSFVVTYSGDATFGPSTSAPVGASVTALSGPPDAAKTTSRRPVPTPLGSRANASSAPGLSAHADQPPGNSVPLVPAAGTAYLGSFVDPSGSSLHAKNPTGGIVSLRSELTALPALQKTLGRPLSIVPVMLDWNDPVTVTELDQVVATGGIPMITWNCGDTDANVTAGLDDGQISLVATTLAQFRLPVFLRWFPDPNMNTAASKACLGGGGAARYVAAYRYIHDKIVTAGAANVTYVWSVDTTTPHGDPSWGTYYPGAADVDWIGADGYASSSLTATVASDFGAWYAEFSADKPLMISKQRPFPACRRSTSTSCPPFQRSTRRSGRWSTSTRPMSPLVAATNSSRRAPAHRAWPRSASCPPSSLRERRRRLPSLRPRAPWPRVRRRTSWPRSPHRTSAEPSPSSTTGR